MILTVTIVSLFSLTSHEWGACSRDSRPAMPTAGTACSFSGKIELTREGKKVEAAGRVVIYVQRLPAIELHRSARTHSIRQVDEQFQPNLLVMQVGDSVEFYNEDNIEHSVFSNALANAFEFPRSLRGVTGRRTFMFAGPMRIGCDIHGSMRADVLVLQNPFWTSVQADGSWTLSGVPRGAHTLVAWEPNGGVTKIRLKQCSGSMLTVVMPALEEAPEPKPKRKNGGNYVEYSQ